MNLIFRDSEFSFWRFCFFLKWSIVFKNINFLLRFEGWVFKKKKYFPLRRNRHQTSFKVSTTNVSYFETGHRNQNQQLNTILKQKRSCLIHQKCFILRNYILLQGLLFFLINIHGVYIKLKKPMFHQKFLLVDNWFGPVLWNIFLKMNTCTSLLPWTWFLI